MTEPGFDPEPSDFRSRLFKALRHIWAAAWYSPSWLYDEDQHFHVFELQICTRRVSLPVHLTSFIVTVSACDPRRWAIWWAAVCVCELITWKTLPTPRKSDPLSLWTVGGKTQGRWKSAGEVAPWPFPLVSMSRGRKQGSETESGNQRATLPAFQYKSRRSLENLNSNSLVDGYDCIFVNVGILENMVLTACQAWLVACK